MKAGKSISLFPAFGEREFTDERLNLGKAGEENNCFVSCDTASSISVSGGRKSSGRKK